MHNTISVIGAKIMGNILVNEIGYRPSDSKIAVYRGDNAGEYAVINQDGKVVLSGEIVNCVDDEGASERDYSIDFSDVKEEGKYKVVVGDESSEEFVITDDVYNKVLVDSIRFFYLQRCGMKLTEQYAGLFAHEECHTSKARIYGTETFIDVNGGWHDAGDYGKYVVPAAVTVADLLLAIKKDESFLSIDLNIPKKTSLPDILEEIKYELDWMLKMQDKETGKVYHKVTCASFCGFFMPEEEKEELIICPFSLTATADFAACMAMAAGVYEEYDKEYAKSLLDAAIKAYPQASTIQTEDGFHNPEGVNTGVYEDKIEIDELYWAAAQMYDATGDEQYRSDFEKIANDYKLHGYGWEDVGTFGNLAYINTKYPVNEDLKDLIMASMVEKADELLEKCENNGYGISFDKDSYIWGSNYYVAENGSHLYDAYKLTGDEKYLKAAKEHMHYLLGKNPCNVCFVTGEGSNRIMNPHHRPSSAVKAPMPGMLSGGPNSGLMDPDAVADCTGNPPAKCFTDKLLSYSTNEVTIYWNSALILLMAQVL